MTTAQTPTPKAKPWRLVAWCHMSGLVLVGETAPPKSLILARGPEPLLRKAIDAHAMVGRLPGIQHVPGMPGSASFPEALAHALLFSVELNNHMLQASEQLRLEQLVAECGVLARLIEQIDRGGLVDDHGHDFTNNTAYLAAKARLYGVAPEGRS